MTRKKGVRSPNVLPVAVSPKLHRKPWSRIEEKALVQFVYLHEDRKSSLSTAVWPSMNPSDPYWNEAVQAKVTSELVSVLFLFHLKLS